MKALADNIFMHTFSFENIKKNDEVISRFLRENKGKVIGELGHPETELPIRLEQVHSRFRFIQLENAAVILESYKKFRFERKFHVCVFLQAIGKFKDVLERDPSFGTICKIEPRLFLEAGNENSILEITGMDVVPNISGETKLAINTISHLRTGYVPHQSKNG